MEVIGSIAANAESQKILMRELAAVRKPDEQDEDLPAGYLSAVTLKAIGKGKYISAISLYDEEIARLRC